MINTLDSVLRIVLIHEDATSGSQALALLKRLVERLGKNFGAGASPWRMDSQIWKFDWLHDSKLWAAALAWAVKADMIVISAGTDGALPVDVRDWIASALSQKHGAPVALVALMGEPQAAHPLAVAPGAFLRQLAQEHDADFFCNLDRSQPAATSASTAVRSRLEDDLEFSPAWSNDSEAWHWGLND